MFYLNGDDLNKYIAENIVQLEQVVAKAPSSVKIVVLYSQPTISNLNATMPDPVYTTGNGSQTWNPPDLSPPYATGAALLQAPPAGTDVNGIYTTFNLGRQDLGDAATLQNFVVTAEQEAPAQNYALFFGDHGAGVSGFNFDANYGTNLTDTKIVSALTNAESAGAKVNLLAFDECLMASAEVEYEVRNLTSYVVASEESVGGAGFNYVKALNILTGNPQTVTPRALATSLVASFGDEYKNDSLFRDTLSAVQTNQLSTLTVDLHNFVTATDTASSADWAQMRRARAYATKFGGARNPSTPFRDLGQFLDATSQFVANPRIRSTAQSALTALGQSVIARTQDRRQTLGLSVVMPINGERLPKDYATQASGFLAATGWLNFLHRFQTVGQGPACADPVDWAEFNDVPQSATQLGEVYGNGVQVPDLTLPHQDVDWYGFTIDQNGGPGNSIKVNGNVAGSDVQLRLFDAINPTDPKATAPTEVLAQGHTQVSLNGLAAGNYLLEVEHSRGGQSFPYSLTIDAPPLTKSVAFPLGNNTLDNAANLGVAMNPGLVILQKGQESATSVFNRTDASQAAWYTFATPASTTPLTGSFQVIGDTAENLTVTLANAQGQSIETASGVHVVNIPLAASGAGESDYLTVNGGAGTYQIYFTGLA